MSIAGGLYGGLVDQTVQATQFTFPYTVMAAVKNCASATTYQHIASLADNSGNGSMNGNGAGNPSLVGLMLVGTYGIRLNSADHANDFSVDLPFSSLSSAQQTGWVTLCGMFSRTKRQLYVDGVLMLEDDRTHTGEFYTQSINIAYGMQPSIRVARVGLFSGYGTQANAASFRLGLDPSDISGPSATRKINPMRFFPIASNLIEITQYFNGYVNGLIGLQANRMLETDVGPLGTIFPLDNPPSFPWDGLYPTNKPQVTTYSEG